MSVYNAYSIWPSKPTSGVVLKTDKWCIENMAGDEKKTRKWACKMWDKHRGPPLPHSC